MPASVVQIGNSKSIKTLYQVIDTVESLFEL